MKRINIECFIAPLAFAIIPTVLLFNGYSYARLEIGFLKFWINITYDKNTRLPNKFI